MKPLLPFLAVATALGLGSVISQQQPANSTYTFSDIALYNNKTSERYGIFSGDPQTLLWNNGRLELSKPVTIALNGFVVPRTLAVNGSNTLKLEIQNQSAFEGSFIGDQIQVRAKRNLQSVYYFDGTKWFTITRNVKIGEAAQYKPTPRLSPLGAGLLSSEEALALSKYLSPKGELLLATLPENEVTETRLNLDPAPSTYRRSVLAIQYGVPRSAAIVKPIAGTGITPANPIPVQPKPPTPVSTSLTIPIVSTLETGSNSDYNQGDLLTRFDDTETEFLNTWKMVAGNQIPLPTAPKIDFSKSRMVTVFLGQRPTGGYSIRYKSATLEGNTLNLVMETTSPSPDRIVTQVITSPFVMLEIKNTQFNAVQVELESK
ncbi:MAG: hypothetical protein RLZZ156_2460 [Deinococcota bacterium]|jgi:hypothetical protein